MVLLDNDMRVVRDSAWFQENIGPLGPVEVIVKFPNDNEIDVIDRVKLISEVHAELHRVEMLGGVVSVATFVPSIPRQSGMRATVGRSMLRNRIEAEKDDLFGSGYLRVDDEGEHWRVAARAPGHADNDYIDFLEVLRTRVEPLIERFQEEHNIQPETTYTGATSAVLDVQRALLADLFNSFLTVMILVGGVMIVAFPGFTAVLLAMIPNVFLTFIMFGALGWSGRAVDIGSVMTASVALGIAVDGTFHYLGSFRGELALGHSSLRAVANAYQHCGRALLQTNLVCTLGMVIHCFSSFLPARYLTSSFILLHIFAAAGDLIQLPALLLGPVAKLFGRFLDPSQYFVRIAATNMSIPSPGMIELHLAGPTIIGPPQGESIDKGNLFNPPFLKLIAKSGLPMLGHQPIWITIADIPGPSDVLRLRKALRLLEKSSGQIPDFRADSQVRNTSINLFYRTRLVARATDRDRFCQPARLFAWPNSTAMLRIPNRLPIHFPTSKSPPLLTGARIKFMANNLDFLMDKAGRLLGFNPQTPVPQKKKRHSVQRTLAPLRVTLMIA